MKRTSLLSVCLAGLVILAILGLCDLLAGGMPIALREVLRVVLHGGSDATATIIREIRLPRALTAVLGGAALALSGAQMQAVLRNPLADPHVMGVSGGAGLGAAIATLLLGRAAAQPLAAWAGGATITAAAFAGALLASLLIILVSRKLTRTYSLLLFGVMLGFIFSALTSILAYSASEESLKLFYSWSAGSFSATRGGEQAVLAAALLAGILLASFNTKGLDILLFGDEYAVLAGAPLKRIRATALLGCCLMTGAVTACCGPLGFVGIVSPHIARKLTGSARHAAVLPVSLLTGASLCLLGDILSHLSRIPLPAGSTIALIGIPVILAILLDKQSFLP